MKQLSRPDGLTVSASIGRHLAFAPVAFAVTDGPTHVILYANALFRELLSSGEIGIGAVGGGTPATVHLTPLMDRVFQTGETARDAVLEPADNQQPSWSCTVWPVPDDDAPERLVIEIRQIALIEGAKLRQRAIAERLLLSALRDQDAARDAATASDRAQYLAKASRDLALSLDEEATRDTVRRLSLPRPGTWCIVDVVESNGALHRLAVVHPDPAKQALARTLEEQWQFETSDRADSTSMRLTRPEVLTSESGAALMLAAHGKDNLRILREIGFGSLLVVPLIVRARVKGSITFISRQGDPPFTSEEIALAVDLGARCAMALDNARLYREADALRIAAEAANQSKSQFLGAMSHELRTPLNAIGGFTELIEMGVQGPVTDEQRDSLARVKANQQHLLKLITEILNFVRIESGRMEYQNTPVSMKEAVDHVAGMLSRAIADKELTLESAPCADSVVAWADPDRVRQVLVNVVMNAVKYTPQKVGQIRLSCEAADDVVVVRVTDTGPGIPPDKLEAIFEPFVQLTAGLADRRGGVGLGLAISRDIARAMDGDLTVESTVGAGSTFTLTLPRAE